MLLANRLSLDVCSPQTRSRFSIPRIWPLLSPRNPVAKVIVNSVLPECLIPAEVIFQIGAWIPCLQDVLNFSLSSRRIRILLYQRLYEVVDLKTSKECKITLGTLVDQPEITHHIRKLVVHPNNLDWTLPEDAMNESLVSDLIMRIAPHLRLLEAFYWDGLEMPDDDIWSVLRDNCPRLRDVGTAIGSKPLNAASYLYEFRNLTGFSLNVKRQSLEWISEDLPRVEKFPRRLWEMLLHHCPNLKELTIGGVAPSARVFEIGNVTLGRWPNLRFLTLGDMKIHSQSTSHKSRINKESPFVAFLIAHPTLRKITLQHAGDVHFPATLALPTTALPSLCAFSGPVKYIKTLPHPGLLQRLSLTSLLHSASTLSHACLILRDLNSLVSLSIWFDLSFNVNHKLQHNHGILFHAILGSCPRLLHLDLLCFTQPTFHVKEFLEALCDSPQLQSFTLTKVYEPSDEDMIRSATWTTRNYPNLQNFTLRYSQGSWLHYKGVRPKQVGQYRIISNEDGLPECLLAYEWGVRAFGKRYSRRYKYKLPLVRPRLTGNASDSSCLSSHSS